MELEMEMETKTKSLVFVTFSGDVLMTLEDDRKKIIWSSILDKISTEEWYQTCKRWKFVFEIKNLEPHDVIESNDDMIKIMCIKIVEPHITFELPDGEFLVSVPFDSCKSWSSPWGENIYVIDACYEADKRLNEIGKNGYGTDKTKIYPFCDIRIYIDYENSPWWYYIFRDKNGNELDMYEVLDIPEDDNLLIVADPKEVYCSHNCETKFHGPLRIGEERKVFHETVSLCSVCGFLHCPSCGIYLDHKIGTSECCAYRDM
jgi:hypothetical protein